MLIYWFPWKRMLLCDMKWLLDNNVNCYVLFLIDTFHWLHYYLMRKVSCQINVFNANCMSIHSIHSNSQSVFSNKIVWIPAEKNDSRKCCTFVERNTYFMACNYVFMRRILLKWMKRLMISSNQSVIHIQSSIFLLNLGCVLLI